MTSSNVSAGNCTVCSSFKSQSHSVAHPVPENVNETILTIRTENRAGSQEVVGCGPVLLVQARLQVWAKFEVNGLCFSLDHLKPGPCGQNCQATS